MPCALPGVLGGAEEGLQAACKLQISASELLLRPDVWKVECDLFAMDTKLGGLFWPDRRNRVKPVTVMVLRLG